MPIGDDIGSESHLETEPRVAWRVWYIRAGDPQTRLRPINSKGLVWQPRVRQEAICVSNDHDVPDPRCSCGFYGVWKLQDLAPEFRWGHTGTVVVGQIAVWGRVILATRGCRAQFAYPKQLYLATDDPLMAHSLRDKYMV